MCDFTNKLSLAYEQLLFFEMKEKMSSNSYYIVQKIRQAINSKENVNIGEINSSAGSSNSNSNLDNMGDAGTSSSRDKRLKVNIPSFMQERLLAELNRRLERCSTEYMYFWQLIKDENPPIPKVYSSMKNAQRWIRSCLRFWAKNSKCFNQMIPALETYGHFLRDVIYQKSEGKALIKKAVLAIKINSQFKLDIKNLGFSTEIDNMERPSIIIQKSPIVSLQKIY